MPSRPPSRCNESRSLSTMEMLTSEMLANSVGELGVGEGGYGALGSQGGQYQDWELFHTGAVSGESRPGVGKSAWALLSRHPHRPPCPRP
jgi:hypothetical protein